MNNTANNNTVVVVGRTNVGKSTLFNRLSTKVRSITLDYKGVTRDFLKDKVEWKDITFDLIDSGGIDLKASESELQKKVKEQVLWLIEKADVVVFMVDGKAGVTPEDLEIAKLLHRVNKPVIIAVNKIDSKEAKENFYEFYQFGYPETVGISAEHGIGINELLDKIISELPKEKAEVSQASAFKVVFIGKPNVGKSSLMNALLKQERALVSEIPGTTREAIAEKVMFYQEAIEITDTPGIRRKRAITGELEPIMVKSSFYALKSSDIAVLLIDGSQSALVDQELKLAFYAFTQQYKALILVINKSDLMTEENKKDLEERFKFYKHLIKKIPVLEISCKTGKNIGKLLPLIKKVWQRANQQFEEATLTRLFVEAGIRRPLYHKSMLLKVFQVKQIKASPIIIEMTVNEPDWFGPSQLAYFEKILRYNYNLVGVPIKFVLKK